MLREAHSTTLASLPESFQSARAELLELLQRSGILYRTETQPILSRDGTSARWMLDSLAVTLSPRGAELAGKCILELLKRFDGRQIATYGLTGVPNPPVVRSSRQSLSRSARSQRTKATRLIETDRRRDRSERTRDPDRRFGELRHVYERSHRATRSSRAPRRRRDLPRPFRLA